MSQNALYQSDCKIFKFIISLEQNYEKAWFLHVDRDLWKLKSIRVGLVKNQNGHSGPWTQKLAVSQEGINGLNRFLVCW